MQNEKILRQPADKPHRETAVRSAQIVALLIPLMVSVTYAQRRERPPLSACERNLRERILRELDSRTVELCRDDRVTSPTGRGDITPERRGARLLEIINSIYRPPADAPRAVTRQAALIRRVIRDSHSRRMTGPRLRYLQQLLNQFYALMVPDSLNERVVYDQSRNSFSLEWTTTGPMALRFEGEAYVSARPTTTAVACAVSVEVLGDSVPDGTPAVSAGEIDDHHGESGWQILESAYMHHHDRACAGPGGALSRPESTGSESASE